MDDMAHPMRPGDGAVRTALAWLVHPITVVATVLLIVNDHVLKAAFPGPLTGKLSDAAGLAMAPPLVALALAVASPRTRPAIGAAVATGLVTVGFVAVKAVPAAAGWASAAWSLANGPSAVRADPTDLLAVPAVGLAWTAWRAARDRPAPRRWLRLAAVLVVLPSAGLAVAATSAPYYEDAVTAAPWQGTIVIGIGNAYHKDDRDSTPLYYASSDGGATFVPARTDPPTVPPPPSGCSSAAPRQCFRVVPGHLRVEETDDGGVRWRVAWEVGDPARARLATRYPGLGSATEYLSSRALAVQDRPEGGLVVVVADGRDGFARRDPSGHWERIGFRHDAGPGSSGTPPAIPPATPVNVVRSVPVQGAIAVLAAAGAMLLSCAVAALRSRRRWPAVTGASLVLFGGSAVLQAARGVGSDWGVLIWLIWLLVAGLVGAGAGTVLAVLLRTGAVARRGAAPIVLASGAAGVLVGAPLVGQATAGWPTSWLVVPAVVVAAVVSVGLGIRYAREPALVATVPAPLYAYGPSPVEVAWMRWAAGSAAAQPGDPDDRPLHGTGVRPDDGPCGS